MGPHLAPRHRRFALAAALLLASAHAGAASLQVAPTSITVDAARQAEGLLLANTGDASLHAQARVYRWTQVDGEDVLEPTRDLAISPPMLEVAAGGEQLVRVVRLGLAPATVEASYRVVVDELPVDDGGGEGLRFVLRYSIPVFIAAQAGEATPALSLGRSGDGRALEIANAGTGHARVSDLAFITADGQRHDIAPGLSGYVLPGASRRWQLPDAAVAGDGHFQARINGEATPRTLVPGR